MVGPLLEGYRHLAPSRPGYPGTDLDLGRTPEEQADLCAALLDHLAIERVIVHALSAGGPTGFAFAARHPERTRAVLAIEAVSGSTRLPWLPPLPGGDFVLWLLGHLAWHLLGLRGIALLAVPDRRNRARLLADPRASDEVLTLLADGWPMWPRKAGTNNDTAQFRDLTLPLEQVGSPTLILHGTADVNVPVENAHRAAERIADARLQVLEAADHVMPWTHRDEVHEAIHRFLDALPDETV